MTISMAIALMNTSQRGHTLITILWQYKRQMRRMKRVKKRTPDQKAAIIRMLTMSLATNNRIKNKYTVKEYSDQDIIG